MAYDGQHGITRWIVNHCFFLLGTSPRRWKDSDKLADIDDKEQRPYQPALRHLALPIESLNLEGKMQSYSTLFGI